MDRAGLGTGQIWRVPQTLDYRLITDYMEHGTWYIKPLQPLGRTGDFCLLRDYCDEPKQFERWIDENRAVLIGYYDFDTLKAEPA